MELTTLVTEHSQLLGSICGAVLTLATAVIGRKVVLVHTFCGKRGTSFAKAEAAHTDSDPDMRSGAEVGSAIEVTLAAMLESDEPLPALSLDWEPVASEAQPCSKSGKPKVTMGKSRPFHKQPEVEPRLGREGFHPSLADAELLVRTAEDEFRRLYDRVQTVRPQMTIAEHNRLFRAALSEINDSPILAATEARYPGPSLTRSYSEQLQHVIQAWRVLDAARVRYEAVRAEQLTVSVQGSGDLI